MNGKTYFDMLVIVLESYFFIYFIKSYRICQKHNDTKRKYSQNNGCIFCFESSAKVKIAQMPNFPLYVGQKGCMVAKKGNFFLKIIKFKY